VLVKNADHVRAPGFSFDGTSRGANSEAAWIFVPEKKDLIASNMGLVSLPGRVLATTGPSYSRESRSTSLPWKWNGGELISRPFRGS